MSKDREQPDEENQDIEKMNQKLMKQLRQAGEKVCIVALSVLASVNAGYSSSYGEGHDEGGYQHSGYGGGGYEGHDSGHHIHHTVEIDKPVPVPVYQHVGVPIPHAVPVPVPKPVAIPVPQPYPVHIHVPQPVAVPVIKTITIPVEKPVPYKVEKEVAFHVEKPVPVKVEKHVQIPIPKPVPVKVPVYKDKLLSTIRFCVVGSARFLRYCSHVAAARRNLGKQATRDLDFGNLKKGVDHWLCETCCVEDMDEGDPTMKSGKRPCKLTFEDIMNKHNKIDAKFNKLLDKLDRPAAENKLLKTELGECKQQMAILDEKLKI
ncbi:hypothetical protein HHI36_009903 [Cryptolaemus montrouzieri]|uniref:Uncharacterized protein n=1 Tax=Cryptolaemus montrouzieri TaxID=559131 RepID=A0ABD2MH71_9CUCU